MFVYWDDISADEDGIVLSPPYDLGQAPFASEMTDRLLGLVHDASLSFTSFTNFWMYLDRAVASPRGNMKLVNVNLTISIPRFV